MLVLLPPCCRQTEAQVAQGCYKYLEVEGLLQSGALIAGPEAGVCVSAKSKLARQCLGQWFLLWTRD